MFRFVFKSFSGAFHNKNLNYSVNVTCFVYAFALDYRAYQACEIASYTIYSSAFSQSNKNATVDVSNQPQLH
jgi:hypothetical protein